jgi:Ca-activated chloride channel homolog
MHPVLYPPRHWRLSLISVTLMLSVAACTSPHSEAPTNGSGSTSNTNTNAKKAQDSTPPPSVTPPTSAASPAYKVQPLAEEARATLPASPPPPLPSPSPMMSAPVLGKSSTAMATSGAILPRVGMPAPIAIPPTAKDTARYQNFTENPWKRAAEEPLSTFSIDVDTGSYANVRRFINRGQMPPVDAVRVEEMVNYFGYRYTPPPATAPHPFGIDVQLAASPWGKDRGLMRIAIQGKDVAKTTLPPANLVFLVDVSGSMSPADRLPLVKSALRLLTQQLRPVDKVSLVTYASGVRVVLPPTAGDQKNTIYQAIDGLIASGGTYGEAGIRLAYTQARASFINEGINRVLLATDGDVNVGVTDPDELKRLIETERKGGISLTALGVGDSNYNEALMKKLADAGDGSYHYLDSLQEAHKVLVHQFTSTLAVIAQDVKLQLEFNPTVVAEYRQIGYELRALTREQFNNDQVDAGDIGAGHSVTALYEVLPIGAKGQMDPLRYQQDSKSTAKDSAPHGNELAWLKLRYKPPGQSESILMQFPVPRPAQGWPALAKADNDFRFATAIAGWGQWMRSGQQIGSYGPDQFISLAKSAKGEDTYGHRAESIRLMELSQSLKR